MKYYKKLIGEHIYLSPRSTEDVELFTEWLNDFETTDYLGRSGNLVSLEAERKYLENNSSPEATFVIVTKEEDKMIGTVSIERIHYIDRRGTLGIFIGDKNAREKGYGTEAIQLILEYGFRYLNLHNIALDVMEFNPRAIRCYKKCGFQEVGRERKSRYVNGKYYDSIHMDILAEEFTGDFIQNKNI